MSRTVQELAVFAAVGLLMCGGTPAQSQLEMTASAGRELRVVEAQLKAAVATYQQRLDTKQRGSFDESQRLWLAYRKAACDFEASGVSRGSAHALIIAGCLRDYAAARLEILRHLLTCEEGDLSCPAFKHGT